MDQNDIKKQVLEMLKADGFDVEAHDIKSVEFDLTKPQEVAERFILMLNLIRTAQRAYRAIVSLVDTATAEGVTHDSLEPIREMSVKGISAIDDVIRNVTDGADKLPDNCPCPQCVARRDREAAAKGKLTADIPDDVTFN